jgi:hypothetical protein
MWNIHLMAHPRSEPCARRDGIGQGQRALLALSCGRHQAQFRKQVSGGETFQSFFTRDVRFAEGI